MSGADVGRFNSVLENDRRTFPLVQRAKRTVRACGPLAIQRLLDGFGASVTIEEAVAQVCEPDHMGCLSARSYLLGRFAKQQGLEVALVQCQANRCWDALRWCSSGDAKVIVNHQAEWAPQEGHYAVLVDHSADSIELDDPILKRRVVHSRSGFEMLWNRNSETPGHVMLVARKPDHGIPQDADCQFTCPRCGWGNAMHPASLFDTSLWGHEGLFRHFYCLGCDAGFRLRPSQPDA
jgi:ABC-type bacteriocin/lantibiotic exporter with double-glycine peptidase domain